MLSTANPSDAPCSSHAPPPPLNVADERASDQLPFQEADPAVGLLDNFSIRDYVFASRINGVETNWPFPDKLLQFCLKHGVRDPLPPFEPPDLVRSRCCGEEVDSETRRVVVAQVGLHGTRHVCSNRVEPVSLLPSDDKVIGPPQEKKLEAPQELSGKKCKLVLKVSTASSQLKPPPEDIASTSSTVSDPMASKVCPVCKFFVSSSNTTMNVHMDQCLRTQSDSTKLGNTTKPSNLKSKPRKKRLMVDIYATAPYCTLEELDRRNGTTWARDLAVVAAPAGMPPAETRRPMLSQVDIRHDGDEAVYVDQPPTETKRPRLSSMGVGHDGDDSVYVDSNGIKLRILSKLNDKPLMIPGEESKPSKRGMEPEFNEGKGVLFSKKKQFGSKLLKHMKAKPLSKKLSSFEMSGKEIQAPPAKDYHVETRRESEEANLPLAAGPATLGKWACSKRSDLPKKKKAILECSENTKLTIKTPLQTRVNSSWSTEDLRSSPKTKRVDSIQTMRNEKNEKNWSSGSSTLANGPRLKVVSRSCGTSLSSRRSTGEEHPSSTHKSDNPHHAAARSSDSGHALMKAKKIVSLKKNILARRPSSPMEAVDDGDDDDTGERIPRTFRKRRSVLLSSRCGGELASDATGTSKKVRTHRSNFSSSTLRSRIGESMERMLQSGRNLTESGKEEEVIPIEEPGHSTPEQEPLEADQCQDIGSTFDSMDKVYDDHVSCSNRISEHLVTDSTTDHADPKSFGDEYVQSVSGSEESHEEQAAPRVYDKKEMQSFDVQMADEVAIGGEGKSLVVQSRGETVSAQESSACLTSHGEVGLDVPPENSSVTSCQAKSDQYQTPALDREPSLSPGSTASTVSTTPQEVYQPKVSKTELTARPEYTGEAQGGRAIEMRNEEIQMISQAKEPEQVSDDGQGPCFCSRREGISREFPFMRQNSVPATTTTVVPSRGKQISALCIAPPRLSSFVSYHPGLRTESPTELTPKSAAAVKFPAHGGLGSNSASSPSQTPQTPNSVLRLMGKDLMVVKEESTRPSNPQPSPSENSFPHLGVAAAPNGSNQESYWYSYSPQLQNGPSAFGQVFPTANHQFPLHSKRMNKKPNSPVTSSAHRQQQNAMKEVIVIDDSPDTEPEMVACTLPTVAVSNPIAQQRQFARFPSHTQYVSRDVSGGFRPVYPKPGPRELQANTVKSTEGLRPLLPNPFYFHSTSTGQLLGQPVYYHP